jgi:chaperonin GroEL (HSP60 family)
MWHAAQGVQLDEAYSLSALHLALEELPRAWAQQAGRDPKGMLMKVRHNTLAPAVWLQLI